ncbi:MAG: fumarylacetoacetate hydrolase family protein [Candidatus Acidiferrales bacterium]
MKLYKLERGAALETSNGFYRLANEDWDELLNRENLPRYLARSIKNLSSSVASADAPPNILAPISQQEVWAAGVTYHRSRTARREESKDAGGGNFYDRVYTAKRPELFFKANPQSVSGHGDPIRIRRDSKWNVPEPELVAAVNARGRIIGYTIGNDVSSRDIEGENPLYLPQAKVYQRSCALGPGILLTEGKLPNSTRIDLEILRGDRTARSAMLKSTARSAMLKSTARGALLKSTARSALLKSAARSALPQRTVFRGSTTLAQLKRTPAKLVEFLYRENAFPHGCFLFTGTGIVPPDSFTLRPRDEVRISITGIGTLTNVVEQLSRSARP